MPAYPRPHAFVLALAVRCEDFILQSYPLNGVPLRLRPAIVFALGTWVLMLGVLGLAPLPELPLNDKALHFFGMGFAAFLTYFVLEVPEGPHKRVWYIRRAPLLLTLFLAFFVGGVVSEFVQGALPYKTFQFGDILANLGGAALFTYIAHLMSVRARRRSEIRELYQPLQSSSYRDAQGRVHLFDRDVEAGYASDEPHDAPGGGVWDDQLSERMSVDERAAASFALGDEGESDDESGSEREGEGGSGSGTGSGSGSGSGREGEGKKSPVGMQL